VVTASPTPAVPKPTPRTAIVTDLTNATIGVIGVRTKAVFAVKAVGSKLTYTWQHRPSPGAKWTTIAGAKSARYTASASVWPNRTQFRVLVSGTKGKATSATATLTVVKPTNTPAKDAEKAFHLTGLRQGVDVSSYQYEPTNTVDLKAVRAWTGARGFAILRNGSGDRPINYQYTNVCTGTTANTKAVPATRDCAYAALAAAAAAQGLARGHYWFNGWTSATDPTAEQVFAGAHTPTDSARLFVTWLLRYGHYTKASTDPLVLDVEDGTNRTKTGQDGTVYHQQLHRWTPAEAAEFLTSVRDRLTQQGYHANLYVYMTASTTVDRDNGNYAWSDVASFARLWVAAWGTDNGRVPGNQPTVGPWASNGGWSIWQYTSRAPIAGAGVPAIDANIAKSDAWTPR